MVYIPVVVAMLLLLCFSAFFSLSEASFFSLDRSDRIKLSSGRRFSQLAARLIAKPERLLNTILLGNLIANLLIFTLSSSITFYLQRSGRSDLAICFAFVVVYGVILCGEVLPKICGVIVPRFFASLLSVPLSLFVRLFRPVLPVLEFINLLSRRIFLPGFEPEENIRVSDLELAVELSKEDQTLLRSEQRVIQNIVLLSDIHAVELMSPRSLLRCFPPEVSFGEVLISFRGKLPRNGYCLLTESDSDEISAVINFNKLLTCTEAEWSDLPEGVIYVPWRAAAAVILDQLQDSGCNVAVVINEFGGTIGILTIDEIIEAIFTRKQGRSRRLFDRLEVERVGDSEWLVNELTSLRTIMRQFNLSFGKYSSVTVGGLLCEVLERFPRVGDVCSLENYELQVTEISEDRRLIATLKKIS
ncbi:MAG: CNNM domain-containing protein [Planctomycetaceae bacterium]|jgi:CBS domain containing-hemolysin-like protein|nr:CNNM domain-containing protein [Planctomycetaceae bacterium]